MKVMLHLFQRVAVIGLMCIVSVDVLAIGTSSRVSPSNGASMTTGNPCFSWTSATGATHYNVQVGPQAALGAGSSKWVRTNVTGLSACWSGAFLPHGSAGPTPASLPYGTYYWRVKAMDAPAGSQTQSTFSSVGSFSVVQPVPNAPTVTLTPSSTVGDYTVSWNNPGGNVTSYQLQETSPSGTIYTQAATTKTFTNRTAGNYSYRVRACNSTGCGNYSAIKTITVLGTATRTSPTPGAPLPNGEPCFSWSAATGATHYTIQVGPQADLVGPAAKWIHRDVTGLNTCWSSAFLGNAAAGPTPASLSNGTYYWRIKAMNAPAGTQTQETFTSVGSFSVDAIDTDSDGIGDSSDNCPNVSNAGQEDLDSDGLGDVCDNDIDGDGVVNTSDAFPLDASESADADGDGVGDNADLDDDNDLQSDVSEIACGSDPLQFSSRSLDLNSNDIADCYESLGFDTHFEVRIGDYDQDGDQDLFVQHNGSHVEPVTPFVLRQVNSAFQLVPNPSAAEMQTMNAWPLASNLQTHISDFDVDGRYDLLVYGVSNENADVSDPIVYASTTSGAAPRTEVLNLNVGVRQFLIEMLGLMLFEDDFFEVAALVKHTASDPWYTTTVSDPFLAWWNSEYLQFWGLQNGDGSITYVDPSEDTRDENNPPSNCTIFSCQFTDGQWQLYVISRVITVNPDFGKFHPTTIAVHNSAQAVAVDAAPIDDLIGLLELVLGSISCAGVDPAQVEFFDAVHNQNYFTKNTCLIATLSRHINVLHQQPNLNNTTTLQNPPIEFRARQTGFAFNRILLHASVHTFNSTSVYSAFPEFGTIAAIGGVGGFLEKKFRDPSDLKGNTLLVGNIVPFPNIINAPLAIEFGHDNYDNGLLYCLIPELGLPGFCSGYNSNSYAKGLSDTVGTIQLVQHQYLTPNPIGQVGGPTLFFYNLDATTMPGVTKPVPAVEFQ